MYLTGRHCFWERRGRDVFHKEEDMKPTLTALYNLIRKLKGHTKVGLLVAYAEYDQEISNGGMGFAQ